jgi:protein AFG1
MYDRLEGYSPPNIPEPLDEPTSFFSKLFGTKATVPAIPEHVPLGLYLHGSVGCGKSFLMDLFYANLPPAFEDSKRRVHFHAFMMDVHKRGHRLKAENGLESDWIVHVARELAREARVLCFDEFQVGQTIGGRRRN